MILSPNSRNFRDYGKIIHYPDKLTKGRKRNLWRIVHTQPLARGWRIAYLVLRDKSLGRLECHPLSDETFEPIKGKAVIFVAKDKSLQNIKCFYLDKPVIVKKSIWHGLITLTAETEIKITENANVKCLYRPFGFRISSIVDLQRRSKEKMR